MLDIRMWAQFVLSACRTATTKRPCISSRKASPMEKGRRVSWIRVSSRITDCKAPSKSAGWSMVPQRADRRRFFKWALASASVLDGQACDKV
eukprot:scaffold281896_cov34-Tisochrysis_lutea.AAC.2